MLDRSRKVGSIRITRNYVIVVPNDETGGFEYPRPVAWLTHEEAGEWICEPAASKECEACRSSKTMNSSSRSSPAARSSFRRTREGSHPAVQKYGQYFVPAATPDDEIARVRAKPYIDAGASPPQS
jgi:hypothetical protein